MEIFVLTQNTTVLGPIARLLGWLMNGIYILFSKAGITNVALTIIVFTLIVYLCLLPLTVRQQRFSKMSQIMNPEIQAIQKKYKNRKDQASINKMNEETQEVYDKYGVKPSGSCVQMIIQLLILIPLYRVIYNVPAYIKSIKNMFTDAVDGIMATTGYADTMQSFYDSISEKNYALRNLSIDFASTEADEMGDTIIDVLYRCTEANWASLQGLFPNASQAIADAATQVNSVNNFLGVSIVYSPINVIRTSWNEGTYGLILIGILVPVLALVTQMLNIRLMPQANTDKNSAAAQMKVMNYMMPFYSFILVFILPIGIGIYWITASIIRTVQQILINRHLSKIDIEAVLEKNQEKAAAKKKKRMERQQGVSQQKLVNAANINAKNIDRKPMTMTEKAASANSSSGYSKKNKGSSGEETVSQPVKHYREGSLAAKANLVNEYNNKNTRSSKK